MQYVEVSDHLDICRVLELDAIPSIACQPPSSVVSHIKVQVVEPRIANLIPKLLLATLKVGKVVDNVQRKGATQDLSVPK